MVKQYLGMFLLVCTGVVAGVVMTTQRHSAQQLVDSTTASRQASTETAVQNDQRVRALEQEVSALKQRLADLEQSQSEPLVASIEPVAAEKNQFEIQNAPLYQTSSEPVTFTEALIAAGLDSYNAEEIARKQSEVQLRRLELRDQGVRDGTIGSDQYRQDLAELRQQEVNVRNEVDPLIYDRYLYHTGRTNRVAVRSVMMGSTAEGAGLQSGDVLLNYADSTIYDFGDLRAATLDGERNESVNIRIDRGGIEMTVSVDRGPLGVRLDPLRVDPDDE